MDHKFYLIELREYDYVLLGLYFTREDAETSRKFLKMLRPLKDPLIRTRAELEEWRSRNLFGKGIYGGE